MRLDFRDEEEGEDGNVDWPLFRLACYIEHLWSNVVHRQKCGKSYYRMTCDFGIYKTMSGQCRCDIRLRRYTKDDILSAHEIREVL